ncbi:hypothetical protein FNV43_RR22289 [Rhamnella rubrinervis]|uniref:Ribosomal protein L16 n=1 Tax=Rhamnella rubrinervis TaxID=2594499 RepID=A0A8K0E1P8_9ROSA|nr:hypothetical protein FNV43_RR22289 [Rhamnella rubrinervis]
MAMFLRRAFSCRNVLHLRSSGLYCRDLSHLIISSSGFSSETTTPQRVLSLRALDFLGESRRGLTTNSTGKTVKALPNNAKDNANSQTANAKAQAKSKEEQKKRKSKEEQKKRLEISRFPKHHRGGRTKGVGYGGGNDICFGTYALQALEPCWVTFQQIKAGRTAMSRGVHRGGKIWVRIIPDKPITGKYTGTRMGSGKGVPKYSVAVVKPGTILYEMSGVDERRARKAISLAASKMPLRTQFVIWG